MPTVKKVCRVCGKSYEACRSASRDVGVFHWQEVACSPECGAEYLRMVTEARTPATAETEDAAPAQSGGFLSRLRRKDSKADESV